MTTMLTRREIFEKVRAHLLTQNAKALAPHPHNPERQPVCQYRAPGGLKCAAGALIADEHYSPELEGATVSECASDDDYHKTSLVREALLKSGVPADALRFVRELQALHDSHDPSAWAFALEGIAKREGWT